MKHGGSFHSYVNVYQRVWNMTFMIFDRKNMVWMEVFPLAGSLFSIGARVPRLLPGRGAHHSWIDGPLMVHDMLPLPSGPSFPIGMGWHRHENLCFLRLKKDRLKVEAQHCRGGWKLFWWGGCTSSFFWVLGRMPKNRELPVLASSRFGNLSIFPSSFSSWPNFFGGHHGHMAIASIQDAEWKACRCRSEMPSKVPPGALVNVIVFMS